MKNYLMLFVAAAVAVGALGASAELNPVIPFLAVTGRPTDAELAAKVAALKADGFDQFLIFARSGLQYKYTTGRAVPARDASPPPTSASATASGRSTRRRMAASTGK